MKKAVAFSLTAMLIMILGGCGNDRSTESAALLAEIESLRQELVQSRNENESSVNNNEPKITETIPTDIPQSQQEQAPTPEPTPSPPREIYLFSSPFIEVGDMARFYTSGYDSNNLISLLRTWGGNVFPGETRNNHIVYSLNLDENAILTGTIDPHEPNALTKVYRFYGDNNLLWTSPIIHNAVSPISFEIDISGVRYLRIEVDFERGEVGFGTTFFAGMLGGIVNAKIVTTN
jgi:hypothetical protein